MEPVDADACQRTFPEHAGFLCEGPSQRRGLKPPRHQPAEMRGFRGLSIEVERLWVLFFGKLDHILLGQYETRRAKRIAGF